MAINKVVNKSTKSHGAMRNVIEYILQDQKIKEGFVEITGPYSPETITWDGVYQSFLEEKRLWNKDSGRMYAHNIISFHKDEAITPEECLDMGRKFVDRFFPEHQNLIGVHQDKDHLHVHILTNSVSYIDGKKLHQTKRDLDRQKEFTNNLCLERGLSIAEKGKHFDGSEIAEGEISAWRKDKYNLLINDSKKSYIAECAIAVLESRENCLDKDTFIQNMEERGWQTVWTERKKHITFQNADGNKVRDNNLSKSFAMDVSKEALTHEFERQNEKRLSKPRVERYSYDFGSNILGTSYTENKELAIGYESDSEGLSGEDTAALIRELRSQERDSEQKRDDSISERENRDLIQERFDSQAERKTSRGNSDHSERDHGYDLSR